MSGPAGGGRPDSDRFELRGELGAGGMGTVYRVFDRSRGEEVALKVLRARTGLDLFRFKREFRQVVDLVHPNLIELHELFAVVDDWMFTMALVRGVPFDRWVRPGEATAGLDEDRLRDGVGQVIDALAALHGVGLIHRDVKPSNVLVEGDGRVVLLDFGLITTIDDMTATPTHANVAVGTPVYMAPEQGADEPLDGRCDMYSVGVMLYEALTGRRPHQGPAALMLASKQTHDPPRPGSFTSVPGDLDELCMQLLDRDPARRPGANEVLARLGRTAIAVQTRTATASAAGPAHHGAMASLQRAAGDGRDHPVLVLITGASGSGKTALLEAFRAELAASNALVLTGRATPREALTYRAADQMVDQLASWLSAQPPAVSAALMPRDVASLARAFPVMQRVPAARGPILPGALPAGAAELHLRAGDALVELLRRIAAIRPLVMITDDAHWATAQGAQLTGRIDQPDGPPCLIVIATRPGEAGSVPTAVFERWRGDRRLIDLSSGR